MEREDEDIKQHQADRSENNIMKMLKLQQACLTEFTHQMIAAENFGVKVSVASGPKRRRRAAA